MKTKSSKERPRRPADVEKKRSASAKTEKKNPQITVPLSPGRRAVFTVQDYKGKDYFMVREQYATDEGGFAFGKAGININMEKLDAEKCEKLSRMFAAFARKKGS